MTKNILIMGSTGMIGGLILQEALQSSMVWNITSIVRHSTEIKHPKFTEIIHDNFLDYSKIKKYFKDIDIVYYCIGVYTWSVPRDQFREIVVDYLVSFTQVIEEQSPHTTFCFLSGAGADRTEKSSMMFAHDMGIAENFLLRQSFGSLSIFRPAYIYPAAKRKEPNFSYVVYRILYPIMRRIMPNLTISSIDLAHVIYLTGLENGESNTYENKEIRAMINKESKKL